ncbi:MAG: toxin-activating lysine-acyltransferase [Methylobacteriaceae bacterium]|nr:toxin-activating lysine-acyltransferase [Methylobacteriaceae bacterium]
MATSDNGAPEKPQLDPETLKKIAEFRTHIHETVGKIALIMMATPRYRNQSIGDLQHLVLEPLMRDRIAIAQPKTEDGPDVASLAGIAVWASVNEETDRKIREQIKARTFPVRLKADEWANGSINWLLDVIAPNQRLVASVIANFKQVVKGGELHLHPLVANLVDPETLKKMGAAPRRETGAPPDKTLN